MIYPGGQVLTYYYDHSGLLTDVIDFNGGKTHYQYDLNGKLRKITRPNGTTREMTYDDAYQVKSIIEKTSSGKIITSYSFDYDAGGKIKEEAGVNVTTTQITNGETVMTYGKGNKLLTYNGKEVKYDASGNMIYGPLNGKMVGFTYDARNRLIEAGDTTYQYDAENNRIGQITNGEQTTYVVDTTSSQLSRVLEEKKGDTVRQYIYGLGLIMHVEGGEYATYHFDNRGSTVAITNKNGSTIASYTYGPYGELLNKTGKVTTPFLYNGKYGVETDANGLYYMRARYYNPEIKRFINQDVVQGSLDNAITLNRFAYANGNPISFIDPFGTVTMEEGMLLTRQAEEKKKQAAIAARTRTEEGARAYYEELQWELMVEEARTYHRIVCAGETGICPTIYIKESRAAVETVEMAADLGYFERGSMTYNKWLVWAYVDCFDFADQMQVNRQYQQAHFEQATAYIQQSILSNAMKKAEQVNGGQTVDPKTKPITPNTGGAGACFVAGTLIKTKDGFKAIEEVKIGEEVYSEDTETGEKGLKKVINTFIHDKSTLLNVYIGEIKIETTEEHPFWVVGKGWVLAGTLNVGDKLLLNSNEIITVTKLETINLEKPVKVYNFEVDDWHTYFVSGISVLVHNKAVKYRPPNLSPEGAGRNGAFREAKRNSGIPVNEQPINVQLAEDRNGKPIPGGGRDYYFRDGKVIREHYEHTYSDDPYQNRGAHFNDLDGNHYDY